MRLNFGKNLRTNEEQPEAQISEIKVNINLLRKLQNKNDFPFLRSPCFKANYFSFGESKTGQVLVRWKALFKVFHSEF